MDLSTSYAGLPLPHPLIVGAGPLGDDLDRVKRLEDAGAALLVLRSLYEEEITNEQLDEFTNVEGYSESFAEATSFTPEPLVRLGPDEYLEHLRRVTDAVEIPVMASLNGSTRGGWLAYARLLEQAGADGIELHVYHAVSDMSQSGAEVEANAIAIVNEVRREVRIPLAVKLAPHFTAFAHFARALATAGADALVLFTRFHRLDLDVEELDVLRTLPLSDSSDLLSRLRGAAAIAGRVNASVAITGGVHTGLDVIKATMAGADVTQMVSALLRHGPAHLVTVRRAVEAWMEEHEWASLGAMRGNMSLQRMPDPASYERANFRMALR
jgi:dihydroorotate dehydrogenase (fumarate)